MVWGIKEVLSWSWNNEDFSLAPQEEEAETDWKHLIAPFVLTVICVAWARKRFGAHRDLYVDPQLHDADTDSASKGCSNEHCVRCQNYRLPTATLLHRLELYALELKASDPSERQTGNTSVFIVDNDTYRNCLDGVRNAVTSLQLDPQTQAIDADNIHNQRDGTQNPTVFFMPLPASAFPTLHRSLQATLNQSFARVVDEYTSLMTRTASPPPPSTNHHTMPWGENDTVDDGRWRTLYLYNQGHKNVLVCAHLPHTTALLESFPSLIRDCAFGNAFFSVIYPGTIISPHTGPTNVRHRVMLPIQIPKHGRATLHVDNKSTHLGVGNSVVFDDSYWHWAEFHVMDDDDKTNTNNGEVAIQPNNTTPTSNKINVTNKFKRLSVDDPDRKTNANANDNDHTNNDNGNDNDDDDHNVSECDSCDSDNAIMGSEPRVTLIFDLWHPALAHEERFAIARMWP